MTYTEDIHKQFKIRHRRKTSALKRIKIIVIVRRYMRPNSNKEEKYKEKVAYT